MPLEPQLAQRAVGIDPTYKSAQWALGNAYRGLGKIDEARTPLSIGEGSKPRPVADVLSADVARHRIGYVSEFQSAMQLIESGQPAAAPPGAHAPRSVAMVSGPKVL